MVRLPLVRLVLARLLLVPLLPVRLVLIWLLLVRLPPAQWMLNLPKILIQAQLLQLLRQALQCRHWQGMTPSLELHYPGAVTDQIIFSDQTSDASRSTTATPTASDSEIPPTPGNDDDALAKARSQLDKFKPKTPSGLRTTSRYSSPLVQMPKLDFGDDEFGRDAQWLYEQCPTGNLEKLVWPVKQSVTKSQDIDPMARQLLTRTWNNLELDDNHALFCDMMEKDDDGFDEIL